MPPRFRPLTGAFQPLLVLANRCGGPLLLAGLMILAFWRILLTDQYTWLNGEDLSNQVMPWLQFQALEWHAGRIPLWSPYEWGGQNLLGQGQPGVLNPLNWLLFAAPLRRGWLREGVLHWWFFLIHYIAALNLYWLARSLNLSRTAAVFGGLCFGLLGFLGSNDWPQMMCGVIWAPLVFRFLLKGQAAWAGFFLGLCWLSGHHQLPIFVSLSVAAAAIAFRIYGGIWTFIVAGLVAAPQLLPGLAYGRLARRWVGMEEAVGWQDKVAYFVHEQYSNVATSLFSILLPGAERHTSFYLGATALALAAWAMYKDWARREVKLFTGLGIAALLYALGRNGGLEPLLYSLLPMIEKARSPSMAGAIFSMSFAALAAIGLDQRPRMERFHWAFGGGIFLLFTLGKLLPANQSQLEERWLAVAFVSLLIGFAYRGVASRHLNALLICAVLIESANMTYFNMGNRFDKNAHNLMPAMGRHSDVRDFLLQLPQPVRVTVDDKAIRYNFGDWQGVEVMGGYLASLSANTMEVDWFAPRTQSLAGIGYHVGPTPRVEGSKLLFQGEHGISVWAYPTPAFPRTWLSNATMPYRNPAELGTLLQTDTIDPRQVAFVRQPVPGLESCPPGEAAVLLHNPGQVILRAHANCASLLVLADIDDPGWSVSVDGKSADKISAFHALRAALVPKGSHTVEWRYSPQGFRPGLALSLIGCAIPVGLTLRRGRQRRREARSSSLA